MGFIKNIFQKGPDVNLGNSIGSQAKTENERQIQVLKSLEKSVGSFSLPVIKAIKTLAKVNQGYRLSQKTNTFLFVDYARQRISQKLKDATLRIEKEYLNISLEIIELIKNEQLEDSIIDILHNRYGALTDDQKKQAIVESLNVAQFKSRIDPFSKKPVVKGEPYDLGDISVMPEFEDGICTLAIYSEIDSYRLKSGDRLSLLFSDDSILEFQIEKKPRKEDWGYAVSVPLYFEDIDMLLSKNLCRWRVFFSSESVFVDGRNDICPEDASQFKIRQSVLKVKPDVICGIYFNAYCQAFMDCIRKCAPDWVPESRDTIERKQQGTCKEPCFVYLMADTINGYFKIGMSNDPNYRERTLQSEKPSIQLIACKQYPSRAIALAIEAALHKAYISKNVRGEWFMLDENDVADIVMTLT